jgi:channel protein (hemolysin III family)
MTSSSSSSTSSPPSSESEQLQQPSCTTCTINNENNEPDTSAFKTFNFQEVVRSQRFSYLADPLLLRGYSLQRNPKDVILSLFACHNETVNIWSHLLGGVLFLIFFFSWVSWMMTSSTMSGVAPWAPSTFAIDLQTAVTDGASNALRDLFQQHHPLAIADVLASRIPSNITVASSPFDAFLLAERDYLAKVITSITETMSQSSGRIKESMLSESNKIKSSVQEQKARFDAWVVHETLLIQDAAASFETYLKQEKDRVEETLKNLPVTAKQTLERLIEAEWFQMIQTDSSLAARVSEKFVIGDSSPSLATMRRYVTGVREWLLKEESRTIESLKQRLSEIESTTVPVWPLVIFCLGGFLCLFGSALYHLGAGHSKHTHDFLCRIDLGGISFMIWGSFTPLVEYVFYSDLFWKRFYFGMGTVLCSSTLAFSLLPREIMHGWKRTRVFSYVGTGMFAIAPLFHAAYRWGWDSTEVIRYIDDGRFFMVGIMYLIGAMIYLKRFPEKYWPGTFDFVFASHQIWHFLVFLAALLHYQSVVRLYYWRVMEEDEVGICQV